MLQPISNNLVLKVTPTVLTHHQRHQISEQPERYLERIKNFLDRTNCDNVEIQEGFITISPIGVDEETIDDLLRLFDFFKRQENKQPEHKKIPTWLGIEFTKFILPTEEEDCLYVPDMAS